MIYLFEHMAYDPFIYLLCYLYCSYESSLDYIESSMVWVTRLSHKVLTHKPWSHNLFLFAIGNRIGHFICEDCYTPIMVISHDQVKLETSNWSIVVMHWTDHGSCVSLKILSIGMTVTLKTSYDIDFKNLQGLGS
jgi:hypothetical protein